MIPVPTWCDRHEVVMSIKHLLISASVSLMYKGVLFSCFEKKVAGTVF